MRKLFKFVFSVFLIAVVTYFVAKNTYKIEYLDIIEQECEKYNIDKVEILSIIKAESNFKSDAVSEKNAIGLMQLTLDTAIWCAKNLEINEITESDLYVPETNIKLGVYYYNYLLQRYNNIDTAIAAYNGGMGNVDKWLEDSDYSDDKIRIKSTPYPETTRYITKINNNIKIYKLLYKEL